MIKDTNESTTDHHHHHHHPLASTGFGPVYGQRCTHARGAVAGYTRSHDDYCCLLDVAAEPTVFAPLFALHARPLNASATRAADRKLISRRVNTTATRVFLGRFRSVRTWEFRCPDDYHSHSRTW